jgi:hypothetical protein
MRFPKISQLLSNKIGTLLFSLSIFHSNDQIKKIFYFLFKLPLCFSMISQQVLYKIDTVLFYLVSCYTFLWVYSTAPMNKILCFLFKCSFDFLFKRSFDFIKILQHWYNKKGILFFYLSFCYTFL